MKHAMRFGIRGTTIGIDLGTRVVKACQGRGGSWRTLTMTRELSDAYREPEIGSIVRALARRGMSGTRVAISVPQSGLLSARASTPRENSGAPIEEITRQELARANSAEQASLVAVSWSAKSKRSRGELDDRMVYGCRADLAISLHQAFAAHGMDVVALEPSGIAAVRCANSAGGSSRSGGLVVDLGWSSARLIAASGGRLLYERSVTELGIESLATQIAHACSLPDHSAWTIGGIMARERGLGTIIEACRSTAGVIERFANALMVEIERGAAFADERYAVSSAEGITITGGGAVGPLGQALQSISGGQLVPGGDRVVSPLHAAAMGLAILTEVSHAASQSAA